MFIINYIRSSIARNLGRSLLFILSSVLLLCFLAMYSNSIVVNEDLLASIGENISVTAVITNRSGSREFGLSISTKYVDGFINLDVRDPIITAESYGNINKEKLSASSGIISLYLIGTNSTDAFAFSEDDITANEPLEFLAGDEAKCIMNSEYIRRNDLAIEAGSVIDINLYKAEYDDYGSAFEFAEVAPAQITVVGFYDGKWFGDADNAIPDIICPAQWLRQQYANANALFRYSSAKGTVADPLSLNDFKESAGELRFRQVDPQASFSRTGDALLISDKVFVEAATQIMRNIQTLRLFLGPSVFLVFLLITLISFFLSRSRRAEIFIAKCLGMKKISIVFELVLENCILACAGGILAAIVLLFVSQIHLSVYLLIGLVFMVCVFAGSLASAFILTRSNMMNLMSQAD